MKTSHIALFIVAVLIVAGVGAYIVTNQDGNTNDQGKKTIPDSDYYPVTIRTEVSGTVHEQTFYEAPKRVVVFFNPNIEMLCYFGLQDTIVAASGVSNNGKYNALFEEHQEVFDSIDRRENLMNVELVRSLDPDLIVAWASTFTGRLGTVDMWNEYGTNCVVTNRPATSVEDYLAMLERIGTIFNMKDAADAKIAEFTSAYTAIEDRTANLTDDQKVKALMLEPGYEDGCYAYGAKFLSGDLITKAGGINLYGGGMDRLTFEQIAAYDPDIIFIVPDYSSPTIASVAVSVERFRAVPGFASLTNNVVGFEFDELYMGGLFQADIIDKLFELMYPD